MEYSGNSTLGADQGQDIDPEAADFPVFRQNVINLCNLVLPILEEQMTGEGDPDAQVAQAYTRTLSMLEFLDALPESGAPYDDVIYATPEQIAQRDAENEADMDDWLRGSMEVQ